MGATEPLETCCCAVFINPWGVIHSSGRSDGNYSILVVISCTHKKRDIFERCNELG